MDLEAAYEYFLDRFKRDLLDRARAERPPGDRQPLTQSDQLMPSYLDSPAAARVAARPARAPPPRPRPRGARRRSRGEAPSTATCLSADLLRGQGAGAHGQVGFFTQVRAVARRSTCSSTPRAAATTSCTGCRRASSRGTSRSSAALTKESALLDWLQKTVVKAEPTDTVDHALRHRRQAGPGLELRATPTRSSGPASDLNAGGNEIMTETLEIAHSGMRALMSRPAAAASAAPPPPGAARRLRQGRAEDRRRRRRSSATSTRPSTRISKTQRVEVREGHRHVVRRARVRRRPAAPDGAQPAVRPDVPAVHDDRARTRPPRCWTRWRCPTGKSGGTPTAVAAVHHVPVGRARSSRAPARR